MNGPRAPPKQNRIKSASLTSLVVLSYAMTPKLVTAGHMTLSLGFDSPWVLEIREAPGQRAAGRAPYRGYPGTCRPDPGRGRLPPGGTLRNAVARSASTSSPTHNDSPTACHLLPAPSISRTVALRPLAPLLRIPSGPRPQLSPATRHTTHTTGPAGIATTPSCLGANLVRL